MLTVSCWQYAFERASAWSMAEDCGKGAVCTGELLLRESGCNSDQEERSSYSAPAGV